MEHLYLHFTEVETEAQRGVYSDQDSTLLSLAPESDPLSCLKGTTPTPVLLTPGPGSFPTLPRGASKQRTLGLAYCPSLTIASPRTDLAPSCLDHLPLPPVHEQRKNLHHTLPLLGPPDRATCPVLSLNRYCLSTYYVPGTVLGAGETERDSDMALASEGTESEILSLTQRQPRTLQTQDREVPGAGTTWGGGF